MSVKMIVASETNHYTFLPRDDWNDTDNNNGGGGRVRKDLNSALPAEANSWRAQCSGPAGFHGPIC